MDMSFIRLLSEFGAAKITTKNSLLYRFTSLDNNNIMNSTLTLYLLSFTDFISTFSKFFLLWHFRNSFFHWRTFQICTYRFQSIDLTLFDFPHFTKLKILSFFNRFLSRFNAYSLLSKRLTVIFIHNNSINNNAPNNNLKKITHASPTSSTTI